MIGSADKRLHEGRGEVDSQLVYHERWLPFIAGRFKPDVHLDSFDDAIGAAREAFGESARSLLLVALL